MVVGIFLTTVAMADDVDDVKAVVREYFATLNAGNQDAHLQQHHMAQYNRFTTGGPVQPIHHRRASLAFRFY